MREAFEVGDRVYSDQGHGGTVTGIAVTNEVWVQWDHCMEARIWTGHLRRTPPPLRPQEPPKPAKDAALRQAMEAMTGALGTDDWFGLDYLGRHLDVLACRERRDLVQDRLEKAIAACRAALGEG